MPAGHGEWGRYEGFNRTLQANNRRKREVKKTLTFPLLEPSAQCTPLSGIFFDTGSVVAQTPHNTSLSLISSIAQQRAVFFSFGEMLAESYCKSAKKSEVVIDRMFATQF